LIKLKISVYVEENLELIKRHYVYTVTATTITVASEANDIKAKLST
jgi:hypothetical protein